MFQSKFHAKLLSALCLSLTYFSTAAMLEAAWTTPVTISSTLSDLPDVIVDPSGNAVAVWQGYDGTNYRIQSSKLTFGGSWSSPVTLSEAGGDAQNPRAGVDADGNSVVIWSRYDGTSSVIQSSQLPFGGSWTAPTNISVSGTNADSCALAMDHIGSVGNAVAVWHQFNGTNFVIQGATLPSGGSWSSVASVTPSGQDALSPFVVVDNKGNSTISCIRYDGTAFNVRSASQLYSQGWGPNFNLSSPGNTVTGPAVAMDSSNNARTAWGEFNSTQFVIKTALSSSGGNWSTPVVLSNTSANSYVPLVAMDILGGSTVIWLQFDGASYELWGSYSLSNGAWSTPQQISPSGLNVGVFDLSVDLSGNVIAIWDVSDGTNSKVQSSKLSKITGWTTPADISTAGNLAYFPDIEVDASGNAVAVWLEFDGTNYVVKGSTLAFGS